MNRVVTPLRYPLPILATALGLGICADYLFYGRWLGVSAPLFVCLCLLALGIFSAREERPATRANLWLGGAALFFALMLAVRDASFLEAFNVLAVLGLLTLLVANYSGEALARLPTVRAVGRTLAAAVEIGIRPVLLAIQAIGSVRTDRPQLRRLAPVAVGTAIALPVLACFTVLLVAADSVFASYVSQLVSWQLPFDVDTFASHALFVLVIAWLCAGGLAVAFLSARYATHPAEGDTQRLEELRSSPLAILGTVEALVVLVAVDLLFGSFMLIQGAYFFGGFDTLQRTGMTYATYARHGFFELVAVACLSLALLWGLALVTRREQPRQRRLFNAASGAMIVLVLGLLVSAFQRMGLYEQAYGYTQLRVLTHSFMIWLAVVLVLFLVALLRNTLRLFTFGSFVAALVYLAALNLANPDALIVRENIARYQAMGKLDVDYLTTLSADATPVLIVALPTLDSATRTALQEQLGWQLYGLQGEQSGWPSWQFGRVRAQAALQGAGIVATAPDYSHAHSTGTSELDEDR